MPPRPTPPLQQLITHTHAMASVKKTGLRVLMSPWLAYGHISPFLQLAKKLSKSNFYIYFCSTPVNLNSIKTKLSLDDLSSIELVQLHLPSSIDLPPYFHTTNGLPPHLLANLYEAFQLSQQNFMSILQNTKPDLIIYDAFQPWLPDMASSLHIPAIYFAVCAASSVTYFYSNYLAKTSSGLPPFPSSTILLRPAEIKKMMGAAPIDDTEDPILPCIDKSLGYILAKSCNEIEDKYLSYFSLLTNKKVVPVGLLTDRLNQIYDQEDNEYPKLMKWLDSKEKASTVYVSFGSETFLSKKEMEALGFGLEMSGVNFIWVIRFSGGDAEKVRIEQFLPQGFVERVKGRGMIVEGWAPQSKILGHSSIGGFVSHCGWGSVTESLSFGVPIIGLPMNYDQPLHGRLVLELGAGLEVQKDENLEFQSTEVARVIREVVVGGKLMRNKAEELSEHIRMNEDDLIFTAAEELKKICSMHKLATGK